jgi:phosphatidylglycerophosphatase C
MDLALFDFDGTITSVATYTAFLHVVASKRRKIAGGTLLLPHLLCYRAGVISEPAIRRVLSRAVFWRDDPARVGRLGEQFAKEALPGMMRPIALERIAWHKARGDRIVVVSASLDAYLIPWCRAHGIEVICTQLEIKNGRHTGRYVGGDCDGAEKARRIRERIALDDYGTIYAYGDREEDREMLELADRQFLCWEEITSRTSSGTARLDGAGDTYPARPRGSSRRHRGP